MTPDHLRPRILLSTCLLALAATPALAQDIVQPVAVQAAVPQVLAATAAGSSAPVATVATAAAANATGATNAAPAIPAAENPGRIQTVLKHALALLGTPYRWGGTTTAGFDCSGLVGYVFRTTLGIELPRVSRDMAKAGQLVDRSHMSPGDLVFWATNPNNPSTIASSRRCRSGSTSSPASSTVPSSSSSTSMGGRSTSA